MQTETRQKFGGWRIGLRALSGVLGVALLPVTAQAQINRSRPPRQENPPAQSAPPPRVNVSPPPNARVYTPPSYGSVGGGGSSSVFSRRPQELRNYNNNTFRSGGVDFNSLFNRGNRGNPGGYGYILPPGGNYLGQGNRAADRLNDRRRNPGPPHIVQPGVITAPRVTNPGRSHDRFQNSWEGYLYKNGIVGRGNPRIYYGWGTTYFGNGFGYYPYYYPYYISGLTCPSLYGNYYGVFPPFISLNYVYHQPPTYVYVPYPVYNRQGDYQGWRSEDIDDYYLNQNRRDDRRNDDDYRIGERENGERDAVRDSGVDKTVRDLTRAWQDGDIQKLSRYVRRDSRVAVYLRGKYQYSLEAGDYLDMTRDAFRNMKTVRFELDKVERKENGVYAVSGRHIYRNKEGESRTVFVSFVLEKMDGEFAITQVGTAPDRIEE